MSTPVQLDPQRGLVRGVRAAVLTAPAVGIAALAHSQVDTCLDGLALALSAGLCWPAAVALLGRRRRLPALVAWLVGAQVVTHVLLAQACHEPQQWSTSGTAAHGVAVLLTAALLHRADTDLWIARAVVRSAARLLDLTPRATWRLTSPRRLRPVVQAAVVLLAPHRSSPRVLRGPPSSACS
jgi:hypothetical protein